MRGGGDTSTRSSRKIGRIHAEYINTKHTNKALLDWKNKQRSVLSLTSLFTLSEPEPPRENQDYFAVEVTREVKTEYTTQMRTPEIVLVNCSRRREVFSRQACKHAIVLVATIP